MDAAERAREYYRALDEGDYEALADVLAPGFVQERPDLTLDGRDRFVQFMREERPQTDTRHAVDAVYVTVETDASGGAERGPGSDPRKSRDGASPPPRGEVAVRGRLLTAEGEPMGQFVDVFAGGDDGFERLDTYTR